MPSVKRQVAEPDNTDSDLVKEAEDNSATQWIFCPYTHCDTSNWSAPTGLGLIPLGQLVPVSNVDDKNDDKGFRYAKVIAVEVANAFPNRVKRIESLAGVSDKRYVETLQTILLGEDMDATEIPGDKQLIPNCVQMQAILRNRLQDLERKATAGETGLQIVLAVGKEIDQALTAGTEHATRVIGEKQVEVQMGQAAGFDNAGKRAFLALGKAIPETLKLVADDTSVTDASLKELAQLGLESLKEKKKKAVAPDLPVETAAETCSGQNNSGGCKMKNGLDADGRCRHHPIAKDE